ncbi:serine/threonine-protein kinase [Glycomyces buryatensis]|nr:serine/threonine-protein kinase [Glycomyces buryatensis]
MTTVLANRFALHHEIARGSVGVVWRGLDQVTGDAVAVKVLREELREETEIVETFFAEAEILNAIQHPGVIGVRDFIVTETIMAIVLEFVEGRDLREHLRAHGPLSAAEAARRCASAAETLAAVHRVGYLHGDVKPGNLMLSGDSGVKFIDFGIARAAEAEGTPSHGTPEYVAPEVAAGESVCPGIDNYALGLVLYEALTGHSAYRGGSIDEVLQRHLTEIPVRPVAVDAELWKVVETLLSLRPADRGDLDAVATELRRLAPRLSPNPTAPIKPRLRRREEPSKFHYSPVTPAAAAIDVAAVQEAKGPEPTLFDMSDPLPERTERRRRPLLLAGAGALGLVAIAAVAVLALTGNGPHGGADVADQSESVETTAPAASGEPSEAPTEAASESPEADEASPSESEAAETDSDTPTLNSDDLSDSEEQENDSTEGTPVEELPGADVIGSRMPGN